MSNKIELTINTDELTQLITQQSESIAELTSQVKSLVEAVTTLATDKVQAPATSAEKEVETTKAAIENETADKTKEPAEKVDEADNTPAEPKYYYNHASDKVVRIKPGEPDKLQDDGDWVEVTEVEAKELLAKRKAKEAETKAEEVAEPKEEAQPEEADKDWVAEAVASAKAYVLGASDDKDRAARTAKMREVLNSFGVSKVSALTVDQAKELIEKLGDA